MPPDDIPSNGAESPRAQVDPLPSKRGEIGYIEAAEPPTDVLHTLDMPVHDLPTRHSVDRNVSPVSPDAIVTSPSSDQSPSTTSITKPNGLLDFFKPKGPPAFGGLRLYTLVIFAAQLTLLGGSITAWVFVANRLAILTAEQTLSGQATMPVHITFIIIIMVQLVFLERLLFRLRGERYSYVHHGERFLRHRSLSRSSITPAFAPWDHPSLPAYATALSQSGVATGDVEDHIIAGAPPPAYGNTRESICVLSGLSRNSLESGTGGPLSHVSRDEQRDEVQDVERVWRLEETMDRLLEPPSAAYITR